MMRLYDLLLRAYPPAFRDRIGEGNASRAGVGSRARTHRGVESPPPCSG
jgi:hypothetical protein